jgi:DNA-binding transcriptional LysR family regulator
MDELYSIRLFIQVVHAGSFSEAARRVQLSTSSVARHITALEDNLGVRLLNRTTRNHGLTEAGRVYFESAMQAIAALDQAKHSVASYQSEVKGRLSVHVRTSVGMQIVGPALPRFLKAHPQLVVDLTLTDNRVDLVTEGIDVAIWLGHLQDSSLIARLLRPSHRLVIASPDYLKERGAPQEPDDLRQHNCLLFKDYEHRYIWHFRSKTSTTEVPVSGNLIAANSNVLVSCALQGLGIALIHEESVRDLVDAGRLRSLLADWEASPTDADIALYVVYPHSRGLAPKVRAFVDFAVALFKCPTPPSRLPYTS